jgi:hypothetical protein
MLTRRSFFKKILAIAGVSVLLNAVGSTNKLSEQERIASGREFLDNFVESHNWDTSARYEGGFLVPPEFAEVLQRDLSEKGLIRNS